KDIRLSYDSAGTYDDRKFDISASVMNPLRRPRYAKEDDFGTWTLAMRQVGIAPGEDGDTIEETDINPEEPSSILGGTNVDSIPSSETPAFAGETIPRGERAPRGLGGSTSDAGSRSGNRAGGAVASRLPEPLTAAQINVMTLREAKIALSDVSKGLSRVGSDSEAKQRLRNEMRMLLDRMKEVQK
ncbi:MAG: hypothetical protein QGF07_01860, partial [Phycisphaerales bacterium]|nr:hypothetical protein [Phycisphaerales bacterium]